MAVTLFRDDFNRADAPTLGPNWEFQTPLPGGIMDVLNFECVPDQLGSGPSRSRYITEMDASFPGLTTNEIYIRFDASNPGEFIQIFSHQTGLFLPVSPLRNYWFGLVWSVLPGRTILQLQGLDESRGLIHTSTTLFPFSGIVEGVLSLQTTHTSADLYFDGVKYLSFSGNAKTSRIGWATIGFNAASVASTPTPAIDWWQMFWGIPAGEKPVYLISTETGTILGAFGDSFRSIEACVVNDVSAIAGLDEDENGIIRVSAGVTPTDLGDGVLLLEKP